MKKITTVLLCSMTFCLSGSTLAFDGPAIPREVPFTKNNVTYTSYIQTYHPWYAHSRICYYPPNLDPDLMPVGADYNQGPPYQSMWVILNPASFNQAWDSPEYHNDAKCYLHNGYNWSEWTPPDSDQTLQETYGWNVWSYLGPDGYDMREDLIRVYGGVDLKVNFSYDWDGMFGLPNLSSGDYVLQSDPVVPVLKFPLDGSMESRTVSSEFGATWIFGECPTGVNKKHAGVDLDATFGEVVRAAHDGTVRVIFTGQHALWADAIIIEDDNGQFTTVYWHVIKYGNLGVGNHVTKGQQIATIADLGEDTHFHFGVRLRSYNSVFSLAGALPEEDCGTSPAYPAFSEFFVDPQVLVYE